MVDTGTTKNIRQSESTRFFINLLVITFLIFRIVMPPIVLCRDHNGVAKLEFEHATSYCHTHSHDDSPHHRCCESKKLPADDCCNNEGFSMLEKSHCTSSDEHATSNYEPNGEYCFCISHGCNDQQLLSSVSYFKTQKNDDIFLISTFCLFIVEHIFEHIQIFDSGSFDFSLSSLTQFIASITTVVLLN